jgi:hypothetical protein
VVLAYLESLKAALSWDATLHDLFKHVRLAALPLANPVGAALGLRSNGNGVDLMRNAPVDAEMPGTLAELYRGQRLTRLLPWYRGNADRMELEARTLCDFVRAETHRCPVAITVDVHSGFLVTDRVWFPYARSQRALPSIAEVAAFGSTPTADVLPGRRT